jgi:leader peptidase (prepilin peptidase)/N-methyltransferase
MLPILIMLGFDRMNIIWAIYWCVVGAVLGSGAITFYYRIKAHLPPWERSMCFACHHKLGILDLVPVLSYIGLRGRCRYCGTSYGAQTLLVELLSALAALIIYLGVA